MRMVYVPPKSIGYFGGDPDNFEWPRHCGDFAFLRAYVGPDGKPADFGPQNVPFKPKKFLTLDPGGHKEGDFAMVLGYPGSTFRYRESYSVEYRQKTQLPSVIESYQERIDLLTGRQRDPELKIKYADEIFSLSNAVKNYRGTVEGIKRADLVARKRAEARPRARIRGRPGPQGEVRRGAAANRGGLPRPQFLQRAEQRAPVHPRLGRPLRPPLLRLRAGARPREAGGGALAAVLRPGGPAGYRRHR